MLGFRYVGLLVVFSLLSHFLHAENNLDSLESLLPSLQGKEKVDILNKLGADYASINLGKAHSFSYQALSQSIKLKYLKGEITALINVGYSNLDRREKDSAFYYLGLAVEKARENNLDKQHSNAVNALGNTYRAYDQLAEALESYKLCLSINIAANDKEGMGSALRNIGVVNRELGNYQEAVNVLVKGLKISQELGDQAREASLLLDIALNYIDQREEATASKYLEQAFELPITSTDMVLLSRYYNRRGIIHESLKEYDEAIEFHKKGVELKIKRGQNHARDLHNLANTYRQKGDYKMAEVLADSALRMKKEAGWQVSTTFTLNLLSDNYHENGKDDKAIKVSLEALKIAQEKKIKDRERKTLGDLADSYGALENYELAWVYQKKYQALDDSLFNLQKSQQQANLLTLYETEKKQRTIELQEANLALTNSANSRLWIGIVAAITIGALLVFVVYQKSKTNKELAQQKAAIEQRDHEKEVLLKEIHHRVKNNLQIISSILNIQSRKLDDSTAKTAVKEGQRRIKSMSLIHEKLYGTNELSNINMKEYVEDLSSFLFKSYKTGSNIVSEIEADEFTLDIDRAIPIGLILNELISNSLKYAFNEKQTGILTVKLAQKGNKIELEVSDSGKGLPENFEETQSMGMRLVNSLTEQIQGVINVKSNPGTSFCISFNQLAVGHE